MSVRFELVTPSTVSRAELFARSLDIDAHVASMRGTRERAVAGVTAGPIGLGEQVTWAAWHFGVPFRMTSTIAALDAPRSFVDEQVSGPFRAFRHEHEFRERLGGCTMIDVIEFTAPFGVLGRIAERLVLARYMRRLIERRNAFLTRN